MHKDLILSQIMYIMCRIKFINITAHKDEYFLCLIYILSETNIISA